MHDHTFVLHGLLRVRIWSAFKYFVLFVRKSAKWARERSERATGTHLHPIALIISRGFYLRSRVRRSFEKIESLWTD